ncbi:MAG TPA: zinc ribbon domain-containing protein [Thermoplasmata archaeon]|nr:zinc ribbon domain-containing protein [Thermoplasmata archaeon]
MLVRFWTWFQKFRKTPWFRVLYLVLLGVLVAELYLLTVTAVACLALLLMPVTAFIIPYYLGERKPRHLAVNALPIFLIATLLASALLTNQLVVQNQAFPLRSFVDTSTTPAMVLSNGTVAPYHGSPGQTFTFRVLLKTPANSTASYSVYLNLTRVEGITPHASGFAMVPVLVSNGTWYQYNTTLGDSIYGYGFSATDNRRNWTFTSSDFGPLIASGYTFYGLFLYYTGVSMLVPLTFYYLIMFMWWYSVRMRQSRTRMLEGKTDIPKRKAKAKENKADEKAKALPSSTEGSKSTKVAAFTCTNCGADVAESDVKCPKCGAVFED